MNTGDQGRFQNRGKDGETIGLGSQNSRYGAALSNLAYLTGWEDRRYLSQNFRNSGLGDFSILIVFRFTA